MRGFKIVILILGSLLFSVGCREKPAMEYKLPESFDHPTPGSVTYITPEALIDTLNRGADLRIFFIEEAEPDDPQHAVDIPGMIRMPLGDMFLAAETLSTDRPVYLACLYGDDSKKMAGMISVDGFECYYLDGGTYRLYQYMQRAGKRFLPRYE